VVLKALNIKGFRNIKDLKIDNINTNKTQIFLGMNGQGKTNILEAIFLLALTKSFRAKTNEELIGFEDDFCQIDGELEDEKKMQIIITKNPKQKALRINGVKKKVTEFMGNFNAILFTPEDLSQFSFSPNLRRRYLDITLTQVDSKYLEVRMKYQEILKQRNALLKSIQEGKAKASDGIYWDEQLVELGYQITDKRNEFINSITKTLNKHYKSISRGGHEIKPVYVRGSKSETKEEFFEKMQVQFENDVRGGNTRIGPHRDDLLFEIDGKDMSLYASRGEWRSLILALKLAEMEFIEEKKGSKPILLLDDVFSELDEFRQNYLLETLSGVQTFITTTHDEFLKKNEDDIEIIKIENGKII